MKVIDPTYLRTIVDGLNSSALQKDNPSSLPQGLVGVYEEAIPSASQVTERKKFLEFFGVWALMKKEVSTEFVVSLLDGWSEEEVLGYIGRHSKWFNSPVSGLYTLYHERFRTFVLQKILGSQLRDINNRLIIACNDALTRRLNDEWERYALEYLSAHLLQPSLDNKERGSELKALAYNTNHWNRQIEVSKDFDWSKRLLNDMMLWASKYDDDQVIECALNKVDLHHMEQNDAPRIVELVAQNDIETALQRIESFGGNDKEGLQRKFILYMLCLMELTLLESKVKSWRMAAIEMLLKHFDENTPVDYTVLNWNDFFDSYLIFLMATEWDKLGLDYSIVYSRTSDWKKAWIKENHQFSESQIRVLLGCARGIDSEFMIEDISKSSALKDIAIELAKLHMIDEASSTLFEALDCAREIEEEYWRSIALTNVSCAFIQLNKADEGSIVLEEALDCVLSIDDEGWQSSALKNIPKELAKLGKTQEAIDCVERITDDNDRIIALIGLSCELAKQKKIEETSILMGDALEIARAQSYPATRSGRLCDISSEIAQQGNKEYANIVLQEALVSARSINDEEVKCRALKEISSELLCQGYFEDAKSVMNEALESIKGINDEWERSGALKNLCIEMALQGGIAEALEFARDIDDITERANALKGISIELWKKGHFKEASTALLDAYECAVSIDDAMEMRSRLNEINSEFVKHGKFEEAFSGLKNALKYLRGISSNAQGAALSEIATELNKIGKFDDSLKYAQCIRSKYWKSKSLKDISIEMARQGKIVEAIKCARDINDEIEKSWALMDISLELAKGEEISKALKCANGISSKVSKSLALRDICIEIARQGKIQKSIKYARSLSDDSDMVDALSEVYIELAFQGLMRESLGYLRGIGDAYVRSRALNKLSERFAQKGQMREAKSAIQEAIESAHRINDDKLKSIAMRDISVELAKEGEISEALNCARGISYEHNKSEALKDISKELVFQEKFEEALGIMQEALDGAIDNNSLLYDIALIQASQGTWHLAENTVSMITQNEKKLSCWQSIAKRYGKTAGWHNAIRRVLNIQSTEAKESFLKGFADAVKIKDCKGDLIIDAIKFFLHDDKSIELLLQKHALYELFFQQASGERVDRLNRTLNIDWAIYIKSSFSAN